ncbi:hypothetical protein AGIG_G26666, partial [Arapaima gigas]
QNPGAENSFYTVSHTHTHTHTHRHTQTQNLTGCSYREVQWSGKGCYIAVSYKGINRKGTDDDCFFGGNKKSWSLICS